MSHLALLAGLVSIAAGPLPEMLATIPFGATTAEVTAEVESRAGTLEIRQPSLVVETLGANEALVETTFYQFNEEGRLAEVVLAYRSSVACGEALKEVRRQLGPPDETVWQEEVENYYVRWHKGPLVTALVCSDALDEHGEARGLFLTHLELGNNLTKQGSP